jgi:hypothetical protein
LGTAVILSIVATTDTSRAATTVALNSENTAAVYNNPPGGNPVFSLTQPARLTLLRTYHWNGGAGSTPGTLWLKGGPNNLQYGPWQASAEATFWVVKPTGVYLPAGTYTVFDSNPATWSYNAQSGNKGFTLVHVDPLPMAQMQFDQAKGTVAGFLASDRRQASDLLALDVKGPVKAHFGLIPQPSISIDKTSPVQGDVVNIRVLNPFDGYKYYIEMAAGLPYTTVGSGTNLLSIKPTAAGTYTVVVKTKPGNIPSLPPYEWKRASIIVR